MLKPTQGSGFSRSVQQHRKNRAFHTYITREELRSSREKKTKNKKQKHFTAAVSPRSESSPHMTRVTAKLGERNTYAPLRWESSLPSLRAVGGRCLEVSLGTWGPGPDLYPLLAIQERVPIRKKMMHKWFRHPRSKQDLETKSTYGPQTWQRGL